MNTNTCGCDCDAKGGWKAGVALVSRILLAAIFLMSGFSKISGFAGTVTLIGSLGFPLPEVVTVLTILMEFGGALALVLGFHTRVAAWALILFTVIVTPIFHYDFSNQIQMIMALKNVAIIGGLLQITLYGAGPLALNWRCGMKMCPDCNANDCGCCGHCKCDDCATESK